MSWIKASNVIGKYASNRPFRAAYICSTAQQILGSEAVVVSFREGTLVLDINSSAQAASIQIQTSKIVRSINEKLGSDVVTQLRFRVS
ncbi:DUF721 domain-containing protein [Candidatus Berkelbacteria bacterium]|nr:DUF721 domain-containing protein [Candidatus Berkelbacteria bacterium]